MASDHDSPLRYLLTFAALLALSGLTLGAAFLDLGTWGMVIALTIAVLKAALVALVFMHLTEQSVTNRLVALTGIVFVGLLVLLMVVDIDTRRAWEGETTPRPRGRSLRAR